MISRRHFLATTGVAVATTSIAVTAHASPVPASTGGERSAKLFLPEDDLKPAAFDRLPLEWHKQRAQKLRERSEEHTSELQSRLHIVCRLLLAKKNLTACGTTMQVAPRTTT